MKETTFHRELLDAFRTEGWFAMKWPDQVVSRMQVARDGKMRFALPKPFDLVLCSPTGRFTAIEAKLCRSPILTVDKRLADQLTTLRALSKLGATAMLAVNFRFTQKRTGKVNRAFLVTDLTIPGWQSIGEKWHMSAGAGWRELTRRPGGWRLNAWQDMTVELGP